jgi:Uma2 family endonuclease
MTKFRYRSADLELFPENDGKRYEIIDGELYVSKQPSNEHQIICSETVRVLGNWNAASQLGFTLIAPGLIFADDDDVAPDVVWVSKQRYPAVVESDHKLHAAPELVIEVLSPGSANARRDREIKLALYSRRGVSEYWIIDWERRLIEVYRRSNAELVHLSTLMVGDVLESPLLPEFALDLNDFFSALPE